MSNNDIKECISEYVKENGVESTLKMLTSNITLLCKLIDTEKFDAVAHGYKLTVRED